MRWFVQPESEKTKNKIIVFYLCLFLLTGIICCFFFFVRSPIPFAQLVVVSSLGSLLSHRLCISATILTCSWRSESRNRSGCCCSNHYPHAFVVRTNDERQRRKMHVKRKWTNSKLRSFCNECMWPTSDIPISCTSMKETQITYLMTSVWVVVPAINTRIFDAIARLVGPREEYGYFHLFFRRILNANIVVINDRPLKVHWSMRRCRSGWNPSIHR